MVNGYWINSKTGQISASEPKKDNDYCGDGVNPRGWRREVLQEDLQQLNGCVRRVEALSHDNN